MEAGIKQILNDLDYIKNELKSIKENMPDKDLFLTVEDATLLKKSKDNEKKGLLIPSKELRRKIGL